MTKNLTSITATSSSKQVEVSLAVQAGRVEQVLEMLIIERPKPRVIIVTTFEIKQYELNWWLKFLRSTKTEDVVTLVAHNWKTNYGALIACYLPKTRTVNVFEPVLLQHLVSIKVPCEHDEVTCMDLAKTGVIIGFRSGKCILFALDSGLQALVFCPDKTGKLSSVTHLLSTEDGHVICAHSQFLSTVTEDGFPNMVMLPKTSIHCYDLMTGVPTHTFEVAELSTQAISYLPEWRVIVVLSAGQHKVLTIGEREQS